MIFISSVIFYIMFSARGNEARCRIHYRIIYLLVNVIILVWIINCVLVGVKNFASLDPVILRLTQKNAFQRIGEIHSHSF